MLPVTEFGSVRSMLLVSDCKKGREMTLRV